MTAKQLREQFEKEHPNRKAIFGNMGVAGLTYVEWLESQLCTPEQVKPEPTEEQCPGWLPKLNISPPKSAEEILYPYYHSKDIDGNISASEVVYVEDALQAMHLYRNQPVDVPMDAVEFAEWILNNNINFYFTHWKFKGLVFSTAQLYDEWMRSKLTGG